MPKIIIVSGPIIVENGKVLLDVQGEDNFWKFCGGKTKEGETLQETAKRRARQELGIDLRIINPIPFLMLTQKETLGGKIDVILVHYFAERIGEIKPGEDIRAWRWIPLENLDKENLAPNILPTLRHFHYLD